MALGLLRLGGALSALTTGGFLGPDLLPGVPKSRSPRGMGKAGDEQLGFLLWKGGENRRGAVMSKAAPSVLRSSPAEDLSGGWLVESWVEESSGCLLNLGRRQLPGQGGPVQRG